MPKPTAATTNKGRIFEANSTKLLRRSCRKSKFSSENRKVIASITQNCKKLSSVLRTYMPK
jgi:hypothetical protein